MSVPGVTVRGSRLGRQGHGNPRTRALAPPPAPASVIARRKQRGHSHRGRRVCEAETPQSARQVLFRFQPHACPAAFRALEPGSGFT